MPVILAKNWWSLIIRGVVAIALGLIMIAWREITLGTLVLLFIGYLMFDGLLSLAGALRAAEAHERWGPLLIEGLLGIGTGIVALAWPTITPLSLMYVIAAWALLTGVLEIVAGVGLREYIAGEWLLGLSGIASLLLGIVMIAVPLAGVPTIALWLGVYALIFGALLIGLGFRLQSWARAFTTGAQLRSV